MIFNRSYNNCISKLLLTVFLLGMSPLAWSNVTLTITYMVKGKLYAVDNAVVDESKCERRVGSVEYPPKKYMRLPCIRFQVDGADQRLVLNLSEFSQEDGHYCLFIEKDTAWLYGGSVGNGCGRVEIKAHVE